MSRRMAFLHLPPIRWLTSFYNPPEISDDYEAELADKGIDVDSDDLVGQVQNQAIDYLYLEVREINPQDKTVEIVG